MKIHKFISTILHPIVIPTIGVMIYFLVTPTNFVTNQKFAILSLVFVVTYLIPLLILILFKKLKIIKSYQPESIKERKLPVGLMIVLFYLLGNTLDSVNNFRDLGLLFYATSFGLTIIYFLFFFKIKSSIHLLSFGISTGFFMVISIIYERPYTIIFIIFILLAGILASARLHLKMHKMNEVFLGFFIGIISPFFIYYLL